MWSLFRNCPRGYREINRDDLQLTVGLYPINILEVKNTLVDDAVVIPPLSNTLVQQHNTLLGVGSFLLGP